MLIQAVCGVLQVPLCSLCFTAVAQANAKTNNDSQAQKYQQVCKNKKQGDAASFAYKGVVFNGVCQADDAGKLTLQPPTPASSSTPETQSRLSETQSEPRPMNSAPVEQAPPAMAEPASAPVEQPASPPMVEPAPVEQPAAPPMVEPAPVELPASAPIAEPATDATISPDAAATEQTMP